MESELTHPHIRRGTLPEHLRINSGIYVIVDGETGHVVGQAYSETGCATLWEPGTYWGWHPTDPEMAAKRARVYVNN